MEKLETLKKIIRDAIITLMLNDNLSSEDYLKISKLLSGLDRFPLKPKSNSKISIKYQTNFGKRDKGALEAICEIYISLNKKNLLLEGHCIADTFFGPKRASRTFINIACKNLKLIILEDKDIKWAKKWTKVFKENFQRATIITIE